MINESLTICAGAAPQLTPCLSPLAWTALADGPYTFWVVSLDPLGNQSPAQAARFTVDTTPPVIQLLSVPEAVPSTGLTITFATEDGAEGSGVAENECRRVSVSYHHYLVDSRQRASPAVIQLLSVPEAVIAPG